MKFSIDFRLVFEGNRKSSKDSFRWLRAAIVASVLVVFIVFAIHAATSGSFAELAAVATYLREMLNAVLTKR